MWLRIWSSGSPTFRDVFDAQSTSTAHALDSGVQLTAVTMFLHEDHECSEEPGHGSGPLLHQTLERADLLLEIAELTSQLGQAAWRDLGLGKLGVQRGSLGQQ